VGQRRSLEALRRSAKLKEVRKIRHEKPPAKFIAGGSAFQNIGLGPRP
jgi:hypothetical protein